MRCACRETGTHYGDSDVDSPGLCDLDDVPVTKQEIIDLQTQLNKQGFNLVVDGRYGQKTRDAYARYLDRSPLVPTQVPPAPIPWWQSKTAIFSLATILVSIAALAGFDIDKSQLIEVISSALTLVTGVLALWANARRSAPLDRTLLAPGLRLAAKTDCVPSPSAPDISRNDGPFGY